MAGTINVNFSSLSGSKFTGQLTNGYKQEDIRKIVANKLGSGNFRLVVNGKEIRDDDPTGFEEIKKTIKNNTTIYVCQRMDGGSGAVDMDTHKATILVDLQDELRKIKTRPELVDCMICTEEKSCIRFCCGTVLCKECFPHNFVHADYKLKCLICDKIAAHETVFVTNSFIMSLNQLDETAIMTRNIDFQICTCGAFAINSTMYSKQKCNNCQRWLCFFCNNDWDNTNMQNEKYTCKANCVLETKITYQLVTLEYNKQMQVPNRRCCPKCQKCGAYDRKCKYHTCSCRHVFCFICLKPKADCEREFKSAYNRPCGAVAQQTYAIFPRIGN